MCIRDSVQRFAVGIAKRQVRGAHLLAGFAGSLGQLQNARSGTVATTEFERETRTLAEAVLRRDSERGWGLLEHPRRLRFRTIDSVCGEIARMLPVLSGGGGAQRPVEDATPMYQEAARHTLMQLGGNDTELNDCLLYTSPSPRDS